MTEKTFKIKEAHIKLARRMVVGWDDGEYGAPCIDNKRPYGNSDVVSDILEILGIPYDDENEALEDFARKLHEDMEKVLQIFLSSGRMEVGEYNENGYGDWE